MNLMRSLFCLSVLTLGGCATTPLPERTLFFGEVAYIAQREDILNGFKTGPEKFSPPKELLAACGYDENTVDPGKIVLVRYFYYWNNVASRVIRNGVKWAVVDGGLRVAHGNLVEVELLSGRAGADSRCATIRRIRAVNLRAAQCEYRKNEQSSVANAFDTINPIGGPGSASIYCPYLETEGWGKTQIGPYEAIAWTKRPVGEPK